MDALVSVINGLQDTAAVLGLSDQISFPSIAVVGSQSAGKSSVLESIVGQQFLPRGKDIVTRTPIILHFVNNRNHTDAPFAKFQGNDKVFTDFSEVEREIRRLTDEYAGTDGVSISRRPIILTITSPNVPTLSLTDLPGLIQIEEVGAQGRKAMIEEMVKEHVSNEEVIMLAVSDGQVDIANAVGVSLAQDIDPRGTRTVGVVTKIDIAGRQPERATQLRKLFENRLIRLREPWIGVVNIHDGHKGSEEARARDERNVFESTPELYKFREKNGVRYLATVLERLFHEHVMQQVPQLQTRISEVIMSVRRELDDLPQGGSGAPASLLTNEAMSLMQKYLRSIDDAIKGRPDDGDVRAISEGFHDDFFRTVDGEYDEWLKVSDEDITNLVHRARARDDGLPVPQMALDAIVRPAIARLGQPARLVAERSYMDFRQFCYRKAGVFDGHSNLRIMVIREARRLLEANRERVLAFVETLLKTEMAHLDFRNQDFLLDGPESFHTLWSDSIVAAAEAKLIQQGRLQSKEQYAAQQARIAQQQQQQQQQQGQPGQPAQAVAAPAGPQPAVAQPATQTKSDRQVHTRSSFSASQLEAMQADVIRATVRRYFQIVYWKFGDLVGKGVSCFLIEATREQLPMKLYAALRDGDVRQLMQEDPDVAAKREVRAVLFLSTIVPSPHLRIHLQCGYARVRMCVHLCGRGFVYVDDHLSHDDVLH